MTRKKRRALRADPWDAKTLEHVEVEEREDGFYFDGQRLQATLATRSFPEEGADFSGCRTAFCTGWDEAGIFIGGANA